MVQERGGEGVRERSNRVLISQKGTKETHTHTHPHTTMQGLVELVVEK